MGKCGTGYTCTVGNICCPSTLNSCPAGQTSIGTCVNGRCPAGYTCIGNQCCGAATQNQTAVTCSSTDSEGPCLADNTCPQPGYACDLVNQYCCPQVMGDPVGPCIIGEGGTRLCPSGYACSGPGTGQCYRLDTGTCAPQDQLGPCQANDTCPPNSTCIGGFCCVNSGINTRRRRRSLESFLLAYDHEHPGHL
ncbi:Protein K04H4.2 a [Aphelenchoides avenae]|nr:Protein K04H4.2 a [Aphelenchus avenae]